MRRSVCWGIAGVTTEKVCHKLHIVITFVLLVILRPSLAITSYWKENQDYKGIESINLAEIVIKGGLHPPD